MGRFEAGPFVVAMVQLQFSSEFPSVLLSLQWESSFGWKEKHEDAMRYSNPKCDVFNEFTW